MKKLIATVTAAGLLVVGGAGAAYAADGGGSTTTAPAQNQPAAGSQHARHPALRQGLRRAVLKTSADTIGVDVQELRTDLRGGQSIAQVAQSKNVDPQTVVDAIVKAGDTRIDSLASSGKISADRAAKLKDRLPDAAAKVVNRVPQHAAGAAPDSGSGDATT
jgi:hypothetical protein